METSPPLQQIFLDKDEYEQLCKTASEHIGEFVEICNNIRDGVFKAASERGLSNDETAVLLRAVLIKTAAENSQVRDLTQKVTAAFAPLNASDT